MGEEKIMKKEAKEIAIVGGLELQVAEESHKRKILARYVKDNMKSGVDFYTLQMGGRETKPSLSKPGSEKVLSLFSWRAEFVKDTETWEMMGSKEGLLCYICKLYTLKDARLVGEGRGARDSKKDNGDVNKAIKMAEKSAQIDAILRTGGLSDLFTQDIEDMGMADAEPSVRMPPYQVKPIAYPKFDETKDAAPLSEEKFVADEVEEITKEGIKDLLTQLGKKSTKTEVMSITGVEMKPENYTLIYKLLKKEVEKNDPLETLVTDSME